MMKPKAISAQFFHSSQKFLFPINYILILWLAHIWLPGSIYPDTTSNFLFRESSHLLPDFEDSYGVVFRDLNNDTWADIYIVRFRNLNRLFINSGRDQPFQDGTIQAGLGGNLMPRRFENLELGATAADINNDGLVDVIISGWGETTRLFRQQPDGRFRDITRDADIKPPLDANGTFCADVNLDGHLDMFITDEHHPNRLLLGDGRGHFEDVSVSWGISDSYTSQGAAFADVDGDGFCDLYVCNWFVPDQFYRNTGRNRFEKVTLPIKHLEQNFNSNGATFSDFDMDGDLDLLVTDRHGQSALYRNDIHSAGDDWQFTDVTHSVGVNNPYPAYGSVMGDFDNNGTIDIWISNIGPNMLFLAQNFEGIIEYTRVIPDVDTSNQHYSTGGAGADFDKDGDIDLFISNKDTNSILYINQTNNQNFIQFEVTGVQSNRDAIGTKIWLYSGPLKATTSRLLGYQEICGGSGYLSQNSPTVHFGIKDKGTFHSRLRFPNGGELLLENLVSGHRYQISEKPVVLSYLIRSYQYLYRAVGEPDFMGNLLLFILLISSIMAYVFYSTHRYLWANHQILIFFSITILLLYGIFIALRTASIQTRLLYQIIIVYGLLLSLTFFLEKIRKLEKNRVHYRKLLRDFSQELILIKNNDALLEGLVNIIQDSIKPEYCAIYRKIDRNLRKEHSRGNFKGPQQIPLSEAVEVKIISSGSEPLLKSEVKDGYQFPIFRNERLFGLLIVSQPYLKKDFTAEDRAVFESLITQTAIALENNQYIEETKILIKEVTESKTRQKYVAKLEKANQKLTQNNKKLQQLYKDLKNTQAQLVQSEKMAGLGQLVAGVAHELNNPISYIYANMKELDDYISAITDLLSLFQNPPDQESELHRAIDALRTRYDFEFIQSDIQSLINESVEGSQRVKNVVLNLRNFSRLDEAESKLADLHEGLDSTLLLLNNEIKNRITIHKKYGVLPKIYCRPGNLNQVFMNLLLNAIQAIEGNGNIWIKTRKLKNTVEIIIQDDGKGIPKNYHKKIFDPFFTTKPVGKGTGLGLSISYQIVQEHRGKIDFTSQEARGTRFKIELPMGTNA